MNSNCKYPKWQLKMEKLQLKLNKASVMSNMKAMGHYTMMIDNIWEHVQAKELSK